MATATKDRNTLRDRRAAELKGLKLAGKLDPQRVVEFARNPKTACHSYFEWDDSRASDKWRTLQARWLIAEFDVYIPETKSPVREWTSLEEDRGKGGYRQTKDVMADVGLRTSLLRQSFEAFRRFESQFHVLKEWAQVISAGERVIARFDARQPKAKAAPPSKRRKAVAV